MQFTSNLYIDIYSNKMNHIPKNNQMLQRRMEFKHLNHILKDLFIIWNELRNS